MLNKELCVTKIIMKWLCIDRANVTMLALYITLMVACCHLEYYVPSGLELPSLAALLFIQHFSEHESL